MTHAPEQAGAEVTEVLFLVRDAASGRFDAVYGYPGAPLAAP